MGTLLFVRHGQASFLQENYDQLSPLGEVQARLLGHYLARMGPKLDAVYCGPLERQKQTAQWIGEAFAENNKPWPDVCPVEELAEFPGDRFAKEFLPQLAANEPQVAKWIELYGASEDREEKFRYFQRAYAAVVDRWIVGELAADGVETWAQFRARVVAGLEKITTGPRGRRVMAISSGGPTAVAVGHALELSPQKTIDLAWLVRNSAMTEFLFTKGRFSLSAFNLIPHLTDPELWTYR